MSTKSTITNFGCNNDKHKLSWHIYKDLHESEDYIVFEFFCSTCYCSYKFIMNEHLGIQLAKILKEKENDYNKE